MRTCVTPEGQFRVAVHAPSYKVANLRRESHVQELGRDENGHVIRNSSNFPDHDINVQEGKTIYEVANAFPFRGATFIDSGWAGRAAENHAQICIPRNKEYSTSKTLAKHLSEEQVREILVALPLSIRYSIAATSTDASELVLLADTCCRFVRDTAGRPVGLKYEKHCSGLRPVITDFELFETIANNPALPDTYKVVMVLRPGVQGSSEIVGDYRSSQTHVYEYLRSNSYIPWGHYAANFAQDCIRYAIEQVSREDMRGLRHLYYQRVYVQMAANLGIRLSQLRDKQYNAPELEALREKILDARRKQDNIPNAATLWGWNFGYDFSGTGYRLHASHQMIHQQYAFVHDSAPTLTGGSLVPFSNGDMVAETIQQYQDENNSDFFTDYLRALQSNSRIDHRNGPDSLIVWQDANVLLFVPKAQVSQWELQIMVTADWENQPVGNVFEASYEVRESLDTALLYAQRALAGLGARMVTSVEFSKRFFLDNGQRLVYSLLPKLPWSMGGFSESQYRFICGHYPEDFAEACRKSLAKDRG